MLSRILINVLENAVKFTEIGSVRIKVMHPDNDYSSLLFKVTDTGIGLSEDETSIIFDEYSQTDRTLARKYGGTGLKLALTKKMLSSLQEFCDRLPKEPEADKAAHIKVESELGPLREQADVIFALPGKGQIPAIVLHPSFRSPPTVEFLKRLDGKKSIKEILVEIQSEGANVPVKEVMGFLVQFEHKGYIIRVN